RYPFINCTDCGPRFTIAVDVPYDRQLTTMAGFTIREPCRAEYEDPGNRRFHAQPNACPACGPQVRLLWPDGSECVEMRGWRGTKSMGVGAGVGTERGSHLHADATGAAARALSEGLIVAVKGLGGYHLACRADCQDAVE